MKASALEERIPMIRTSQHVKKERVRVAALRVMMGGTKFMCRRGEIMILLSIPIPIATS